MVADEDIVCVIVALAVFVSVAAGVGDGVTYNWQQTICVMAQSTSLSAPDPITSAQSSAAPEEFGSPPAHADEPVPRI